MVKNMGHAVTQSEFSGIIGVSQQTVSELIARGVLPAGGSIGEWVQAYCAHLREVAAARAAAEVHIDFVHESLAQSLRSAARRQTAARRLKGNDFSNDSSVSSN